LSSTEPAAGFTGGRGRQVDGGEDPAKAAARDAHDAWLRGQAALAAGDADAALRWLDRAARIAPEDDIIALGVATACLGRDSARSARLFARVAKARDVREAWFGLAVARLRCGEADGAAKALGQALARHVAPADVAVTADTVVRAAGAAGWCAVSRQGVLTVAPAEAGPLAVSLDGVSVSSNGMARRLPPAWRTARFLEVTVGGRGLIGSPIDLAAIRRVEGCVEWREGGLSGWAWHPADPDADPILRVQAGAGGRATVRARRLSPQASGAEVLRRARGFTLSAAALARLGGGPVRVTGADGTDLLGSPVYPAFKPSDPVPPAARGAAPRRGTPRRVDVILPVRDGGPLVLACLESVLATVGRGTRVIVVDDASRDPAILAALAGLARRRRIRLIRHETSLGFPRSANAGLRVARPSCDVVLLNSDTLLPPLWLDRLRDAAYGSPDIGTVCPISNNATILSYPSPGRPHPMPDRAETERLASLAHRANGGRTVDVPTAVGFCMFIRRDCLDAVGLLREDVFAQGYGEENDFAMRARGLGWRHVVAPGVFVAHRGGLSFAGAAAHLARRNARVLAELHPEYDGLVARFVAADPLAPARRRLDAVRWRRSIPDTAAVVLVSHDQGGGVERHLAVRCAALLAEGRRPIVLRPGPDRAAVVSDGLSNDFPNLRFAMPGEAAALARFLSRQRPAWMEFHHLLDHHPGLMTLPALLGVPYRVTVHDYAWFCPRVTLLGGARRYCGEPAVAGCEACVTAHGSALEEDIPVAALRVRAAGFLRGAQHLDAPSTDTAARMRRQFPGLAISVVPHEPEPSPAPVRQRRPGQLVKVCVVGGIGAAKGYDVLLAAAADAAERNLPLDFTVVGLTDDDQRLMATGRAFVTGPYAAHEAVELIDAQQADLAFVPTIVPETWCFSLSEAWRAGLDVLAFDIGAQAERIRRTGRGWVVPLGLPAPALNDVLLAIARQTGHEWLRRSATKDCDLVVD